MLGFRDEFTSCRVDRRRHSCMRHVRHQGPALFAAAGATCRRRAARRNAAGRTRSVLAAATTRQSCRRREKELSAFTYRDGELFAENVPLSAIAAAYGTPCYVYSRASLTTAFREYDDAFAG